MFSYIVLYIYFIACIAWFHSVISIPLIDDHLLFIGDRQAFDGYALPHGSINLIENELLTTIGNLSFNVLIEEDHSIFPVLESTLQSPINQPNITIIMLGTEIVKSTIISIDYFEYYLNRTLNMINNTNCREVYIISPFLYGEKSDNSNPYDDFYEEITYIGMQLSKYYKYKYIDIRNLLLKYLQKNNNENLSHSILTYDGFHLNPYGQRLIATEILYNIGIKNITTFKPIKLNIHNMPILTTTLNINPNNFYYRLLSMPDKDMYMRSDVDYTPYLSEIGSG